MKSYYADTVEAAMAKARKELGPEAVLVTSRAAGSEASHLGHYEVVFATDFVPASSEPEESARPERAAQADAGAARASYQSLMGEIRGLRREFESWRRVGASGSDQPLWMIGEAALAEAFNGLLQAEVGRDLAENLMAAVYKRLRSSSTAVAAGESFRHAIKREMGHGESTIDAARVRAALAEEIQGAFCVDSSLGMDSNPCKIVALVGPPGAGKTAMIARMAVRYGLSTRKPTMLLSLDTLRVAASEQLRWYASILGLGFQLVPTNRALGQVLEEHHNKELILIDTPGLSVREMEDGCDTADYLAKRTDIQKHLVLPASLRSADLATMAAAYSIFEPSRLIFTRMDETGVFGPVLAEAVRTKLPLSFFGTGQRVPEDMQLAEKPGLLNKILKPCDRTLTALSAA